MVTQNALNILTGASGTVLQGAGIGTACTFSTPTYPSTSGTTGTVLRSDGTNNVYSTTFTIDSTGLMLNTAQPVFSAYRSSSASNVTGDSTIYTVVYNSTNINVGTSYNTTTGVFTVPITGFYMFNCTIVTSGFLVGHVTQDIGIGSSGSASWGTRLSSCNPFNIKQSAAFVSQGGSWMAKLVAGDTVSTNVTVIGSTKVISVYGDATGLTTFSGYLFG